MCSIVCRNGLWARCVNMSCDLSHSSSGYSLARACRWPAGTTPLGSKNKHFEASRSSKDQLESSRSKKNLGTHYFIPWQQCLDHSDGKFLGTMECQWFFTCQPLVSMVFPMVFSLGTMVFQWFFIVGPLVSMVFPMVFP